MKMNDIIINIFQSSSLAYEISNLNKEEDKWLNLTSPFSFLGRPSKNASLSSIFISSPSILSEYFKNSSNETEWLSSKSI